MPDAGDVGAGIARRAFLGAVGLAAGLALGGGIRLLGRRPVEDWDFATALAALWESLSPVQRKAVGRPWDHPSRQLVGHVACLGAPRVASVLTASQQVLVHRLYETLTAAEQRRRFGRLVGLEGGGLDPCEIAIYGDPRGPRCQLALSGGHLLLRGGGGAASRSAFGGPLAYGHQIGNGVPRLPGNAFAYHGDAANALVAGLDAPRRRQALVAGEPPFETAVQLQGAGGVFAGLPLRELDDPGKEAAQRLLGSVLSCYAESERAEALGCLRRNGGLESLHLAVYTSRGFYPDGAAVGELDASEQARRGDPYWHVWRLEGPGTVLHFRGWPHVHAALHLAEDGGAGQHVGEVLAENGELLEGERLRTLLLEALREATAAELAFLPGELPARFPPGPVSTGLVWSLDPYADEVAVARLRGRDAAAPLREQLAARGVRLEPGRVYRIATPRFASGAEDLLGPAREVERSGLGLRHAYEAYFRRHGLTRLS
jgi:hypothetical protein